MKTSTEELRNAGVVMIKQPSDKMTLRLPTTEGKGVIPGPSVVKNCNGEDYTKLHFPESSLEFYWLVPWDVSRKSESAGVGKSCVLQPVLGFPGIWEPNEKNLKNLSLKSLVNYFHLIHYFSNLCRLWTLLFFLIPTNNLAQITCSWKILVLEIPSII